MVVPVLSGGIMKSFAPQSYACLCCLEACSMGTALGLLAAEGPVGSRRACWQQKGQSPTSGPYLQVHCQTVAPAAASACGKRGPLLPTFSVGVQ
jgi:hypothetical protein